MISSHVKITCYFHMWKYHCSYGYIINRAFRRIKLFQWNGLVFHWCLYNKLNITWPLGDAKFLFSCWKYFTHSLRSLVKYFSKLEEKFRISARPCNILYISTYISFYQSQTELFILDVGCHLFVKPWYNWLCVLGPDQISRINFRFG